MAEVETTREGAVLTITLNRPDVLNALNAATLKALAAALKDARADDLSARWRVDDPEILRGCRVSLPG